MNWKTPQSKLSIYFQFFQGSHEMQFKLKYQQDFFFFFLVDKLTKIYMER